MLQYIIYYLRNSNGKRFPFSICTSPIIGYSAQIATDILPPSSQLFYICSEATMSHIKNIDHSNMHVRTIYIVCFTVRTFLIISYFQCTLDQSAEFNQIVPSRKIGMFCMLTTRNIFLVEILEMFHMFLKWLSDLFILNQISDQIIAITTSLERFCF